MQVEQPSGLLILEYVFQSERSSIYVDLAEIVSVEAAEPK
jgi:hypothetical protein